MKIFNYMFLFLHYAALWTVSILWRTPATRCWCTWSLPWQYGATITFSWWIFQNLYTHV